MSTNYNDIAELYRSSKQVPWRFHVEQHSLFDVLGDVQGLSILDLACGEGHYSRLLKAMGAARVMGVDLSPRMIELAQASERQRPMGVEYQCADARDLSPSLRFDVVTAAYLFNYARTKEELLEMCRTVSGSLKPGGRFVGVNNNPGQDVSAFERTRKYGFIKMVGSGGLDAAAAHSLAEGTPIRYRLFVDEGEFEIENYHLAVATHEAALREAGLGSVQWHAVKLSPREAAGPNRSFWDDFFLDPPVVIIEARKEE